MTTEKKGCLAFAVCGSFCTLEDALGAAQAWFSRYQARQGTSVPSKRCRTVSWS